MARLGFLFIAAVSVSVLLVLVVAGGLCTYCIFINTEKWEQAFKIM